MSAPARPAWVDRHPVLVAFLLVAFIAASVVISFRVWPAAAAAEQVPYTDAQATGYLTLYNKAGKAIKSGSVQDKPFVWRAVASRPAPAQYGGTGRKATLLAFQPREGASPAEWSGDSLTGASAYPDAAHPTVQAGQDDFTLQDFIAEFPPRWNGLLQLRMYLSAPGRQVQSTGYVSTDIKVSGNTWTVVGGGPGAGPGGSAIAGAIDKPHSSAGSPAPSGSAAPSSSVAASGSADPAAAGAGGDEFAVTELPHLRTPGYLFIAAAVLVAVVFGGVLLRRRRYAIGGL